MVVLLGALIGLVVVLSLLIMPVMTMIALGCIRYVMTALPQQLF